MSRPTTLAIALFAQVSEAGQIKHLINNHSQTATQSKVGIHHSGIDISHGKKSNINQQDLARYA